ncbi:MAG: thioredoxin family protein [Chloroflexi bacterium]|nr:thioredoxin family protein [Chloroflexota bacterium]
MKDHAKLVFYARETLANGAAEYDGYRPKLHTLRQIGDLVPRARVEIVSADWCKDCRREVPRFVRIVEHLPGWDVELLSDDPATRERLAIERIPTFVIRSVDSGQELGRIIESPASGRLENDLLAIAERHPSQIRA